MDESGIKEMMTSAKCSGCGQRYEIENIEVLGHHEDMWFLSVFCVACRAQYLVTAVIDGEGAPETVTDLSAAELEKFRDAESLKFGNHLGTVFPHVGSLLFGRWRIAVAAVTPNAKQQRLPTARHDDSVLLKPVGTLLQRQSQSFGYRRTGQKRYKYDNMTKG